MRHKRSGYKLKRDAGSRNSLLKGLVTSVIEQERIITTVPKAKAAKKPAKAAAKKPAAKKADKPKSGAKGKKK